MSNVSDTLVVKNTYVKNVALSTAFGGSNLTLRKLKALHVLALTVRETFFMRHPHYDLSNIDTITKHEIEQSSSMYSIEESQIMKSMGYDDRTKYYSMTQILQIFEELSNETLHFDGLGIVRDKTESDTYTGFTRPLGSAERENGVFKFYIPPAMVSYIIQPELSFNAPISWNGYKNKFAPAIYETCLYYYQNGNTVTDWFSLATIRQITSTLHLSTYDVFNNLKTRVLDKTITNINDSDDFNLFLTLEAKPDEPSTDGPLRKGRKSISRIRFHIKEKVTKLNIKTDVRNSILLSAQRAEIESFGVPKNAIDSVLSECKNANGELSLQFIKWTIKKAHEIRSLKKFSPTENNKKEHNFGGYYRKNILRANKANWFEINELLQNSLEQRGLNTSLMQQHELEQSLETLRSELERKIATQFISSMTEFGLVALNDNFYAFLESQLPHIFQRYAKEYGGASLNQLAECGNAYLYLFLDYTSDLFTPKAYQSVL